MDRYAENLGSPNIRLAGLQIWVHSRQFPASEDYWDANWLNVTVHCGAQGADVWTGGAIIHLSELVGWVDGCEAMTRNLSGKASLECIEPDLSVQLRASPLGHIAMTVEITPDHLTQQHKFEFEVDQSYLARLVQDCRKVLGDYPITGVRGEA